jgi:hypothetical protein
LGIRRKRLKQSRIGRLNGNICSTKHVVVEHSCAKPDLGWLAPRRLYSQLKNPVKMNARRLSRLAHEGKYPFCQSCGTEILVDMLVHRRAVTYPGGIKLTKYFCDECETSGRMYAVGKGEEDK